MAFVALSVTVDLASSDRFFDFSFLSYARFREGTLRRGKKSSPTPLWGHRLTVTALALSARGLDNTFNITTGSTAGAGQGRTHTVREGVKTPPFR